MPPANQAHVVSEELFEFLTQMEIHKALRMQYPISVVTVVLASPSANATQLARLVNQVAPGMSRMLRSTDALAPRSSVPGLRILLVDTHLADVEVVIDRITEELRQTSALRIGVACFPATAQSASELFLVADSGADPAE